MLAFILAENGYPAGSAPLDAAHLDEIAFQAETDARETAGVTDVVNALVGHFP